MNTHESYVSLETAQLLKEAGFEWECDMVYCNDDQAIIDNSHCPCNWNSCRNNYSAPTLAIAQKWLREEKEIYAEAYISESHHAVVWMASVYQWEKRPLGRELRDKCLCTGIGPVYFDTYEQALEESVKKCLTLLLEE